MDNTTILYNAIQRTYRNAVVDLIRIRFDAAFGGQSGRQLESLFGKTDEHTGQSYWDQIRNSANERRSGGTGELSTPIHDDFDLLGVEHFFNVFEKHFSLLCPAHAQKPKKELNQARQALTTWMKQIKNIRDPVSHPVTEDINYEDSANVR